MNIDLLRDLYGRVKAATGPDDTVNVWVENIFDLKRFDPGPWVPGEGHIYEKRLAAHPFSASADFVETLRRRFLPDWKVSVFSPDEDCPFWQGCLAKTVSDGTDYINEFAPTEPLARLLAIIAALILVLSQAK